MANVKTRPPAEGSINLDLLPASLRELVRVVGFIPAMRLVQCRGGQSIMVPKRLDMQNPTPAARRLLDDLGSLQALAALIDWRGGEWIDHLPKYDAVARQLRHEHVRQLRRDGFTCNEIAAATGYSKRWVIEVIGLEERDARQWDLFGEPGMVPATRNDRSRLQMAQAGTAANPFGLSNCTEGEEA